MKLIDITALGIRLVGIMMLINCVSEVIILVSALLIKFPSAVAKMVVTSASHGSPLTK